MVHVHHWRGQLYKTTLPCTLLVWPAVHNSFYFFTMYITGLAGCTKILNYFTMCITGLVRCTLLIRKTFTYVYDKVLKKGLCKKGFLPGFIILGVCWNPLLFVYWWYLGWWFKIQHKSKINDLKLKNLASEDSRRPCLHQILVFGLRLAVLF